jgi:uncharacterized membrane protein/Mg-chelatase subunit ChlD
MFNYQITFQSPWYLLLLLLVPVVWWLSFRSLGALGPVRRALALGVRTVVMVLFILAVAEVQMVRTSDRLTVIYLLDQSLSIPVAQRRAMIDYVNAAIEKHRQHEDRAGVIVFGRDAAIEIPPFDDDVQVPATIESLLNPEHTNLAGAMKLAQATFPEDAAKRIVLVSDGNENVGSAVEQARELAGSGIGIDVVPIRYSSRSEVVVQRLVIPPDVRRGQPFDLKVVVSNTGRATGGDTGTIPGTLVLSQLAGDRTVVLSRQKVTLPPGKKVFTMRQRIDAPEFYKYEALFIPDRPEDDGMPQNNRATAFTHVRGKGQVLFIEDCEHRGEFAHMVESLRRQGLEVTVKPSDQLFTSLAELQPFDTVVLANVPRATNQDVHFTDDQIEMLVRNTQQMGAGLVMLGGPNSFGAGGWTNTKLEEAMPVDFQIKSAKVIPRGALALLMHASEIPRGNYWQKVVAAEALKALGPRDYCGVIHWNGREQWLWRGGITEIGANRKRMLAKLDRMTPGDMPDFDPAMIMAQRAFAGLPDAAVKHMIVISDGDPAPPSGRVIKALAGLKVTVSTVAVGSHGPAGSRVLARLSSATGGKYYVVRNARALPRIFQREARRVARPLVWESKVGVRPRVEYPHEILSGVDGPLPPIHGFVMTSVKENPLVEVALVSPRPADPRNATILACWRYGLGKAVAFTSDAGARWATRWTGWKNYDKLFGQMVRWSMRPTGRTGKFTVATSVEDGRVQVVVTALDKDDEFLNFLNMSGTVVGPDLKPLGVKMQQTAPGRYLGSFPARASGSYFLMVSPQAGQAPIRTGINVPYSSEFRDRATNEALLDRLADLVPKGGSVGSVIEAPKDARASKDDAVPIDRLLAVNTFRHNLSKATSSQDAWHWLVLVAGCLFFADVFVRRVQISFTWVPTYYGLARDRVLGRPATSAKPETMERLRSRKAEVTDRLEQLRATARFESPAEKLDGAPDALESVEELGDPTTPPVESKTPRPGMTPEKDKEAEQESYTERLLRAKKQVWEKRGKK